MSDEDETNEFEYHYFENEANLTVRKHRRRRPLLERSDDAATTEHIPMFPSKEPVQFKENVVYHQNDGDYRPHGDDFVSYVIADFKDVFPFGYPTEQFLCWLKNDVYIKFEEAKRARREAIALMKREVLDGTNTMKESKIKKEVDTGLVPLLSKIINMSFKICSIGHTNVRASVRIVDILYNALRVVQKDSKALALRLAMEHPRESVKNAKVKLRPPAGGSEPSTEINKFGFNPALERRLSYKFIQIFSKQKETQAKEFVNINYLLDHEDYRTAYRCDVQKYEKASILNIQKSEEYKREEEFTAIECSFKKIRNIMLQKKFETIYTENLNTDESEQKRIEKTADRENNRKKQIRNPEPLETKGVTETFFDKNNRLKLAKGPFFKLMSKNGIINDDFVNCTTKDLIDYSKEECLRVFITGPPRCGKSTLAKNISKRLDLVHVCVENWIKKLLEKIKNYEPPEDLEEDQEPPEWLTPLEKQVNEFMKKGTGPNEFQTLEILKQEI
jgi:hypothetical protein